LLQANGTGIFNSLSIFLTVALDSNLIGKILLAGELATNFFDSRSSYIRGHYVGGMSSDGGLVIFWEPFDTESYLDFRPRDAKVFSFAAADSTSAAQRLAQAVLAATPFGAVQVAVRR